MNNILIMIPAYNPPSSLVAYAQDLLSAGIKDILVVDDGSRQEFASLFAQIGHLPGCTILRHAINLGKGRALKNAFNYCLNHTEYSGMITVDCDGQHTVEDVLRMKAAMEADPTAFFLGCRDFDSESVPFKSRYGNKITCAVFRLLYGVRFRDTQTGLRGFSRQAMIDFIQLSGERFEFETNMLICCCQKKLPVQELSIQTVYINGNAETHFRPVRDALRIYSLIFKSFFLYVLSSFSSFLIDILLFTALSAILPLSGPPRIFASTLGARICSSAYNFLINRNVVFSASGTLKKAILRYYILCFGQMLLSAGLVASLFVWLRYDETVIKIIVDSLLFLISYRIQQTWVFRNTTR